MRYVKQQPISIDKQIALLRFKNPTGKLRGKRGSLLWTWTIQPTPVSRIYVAKLEYTLRKAPHVFILEPNLKELAGGRRIPHLYDQQRIRLCLYLPRTGEWSSQQVLSDTIVPWTALWLYFFEEWLISDEWKGGGVHLEESEKEEDTTQGKPSPVYPASR